MYTIRTIIWFIYFSISLFLSIPLLVIATVYDRQNKIIRRDAFVDKWVSIWAKSLVKLTGSKIKVLGEENIPKNESVLFVCNHQGNFDIPILLGYIEKPKGFIAKLETSKLPIIKTWMKLMKCIFMDRKDIRQSVNAIKKGTKYLTKGYSLVIFPEGTRSKDGSLGEFKPGSLKLSTKSGVPIIPITIKGSNKIMSKKSLIIKPAYVEIIISPAIKMDNIPVRDTKGLTEKVRNIIANNL